MPHVCLTCVPDVSHRAAYGRLSYATVHRLLNHPTASVNLGESSAYRIPNFMRSELSLPCNKFLFNCLIHMIQSFLRRDPFVVFASPDDTVDEVSTRVRFLPVLHARNHLQHNCYLPTASSRVIKEIHSSLITTRPRFADNRNKKRPDTVLYIMIVRC